MPKQVTVEIPAGKFCGDCPFTWGDEDGNYWCNYVYYVLGESDFNLNEGYDHVEDVHDTIKHARCPGKE